MADEEDITRMHASKVSSTGVPWWIHATRSPFRLFISSFSSSKVDIVRCGEGKRLTMSPNPFAAGAGTWPWFYKLGKGTSPVPRLPLAIRSPSTVESVQELGGHPRCPWVDCCISNGRCK